MPELNRAQYHDDTRAAHHGRDAYDAPAGRDDGDPLAELERIVTESVTPSRAAHRAEAHDPTDYPRRDTSWRDPQARTTVRAVVTPQPMPGQLDDLETQLRSVAAEGLRDATPPQYAARTAPVYDDGRAPAAAQRAGQVRGYSTQGNFGPEDEVTMPLPAATRTARGQEAPMSQPPRAPYADPAEHEFNAYGRDPYEAAHAQEAYDPAGAMHGEAYHGYAPEEAAYYEDEAQPHAHAAASHAAPDYYAEPYYDPAYDEAYAAPAPARKPAHRGNPLLAFGAVAAAVLVVGVGGYMAFRGFSHADVSSPGGIPLIRADTKPVKEMAPPSQPTRLATGPNLDVARDGQDKLVTQTEDPVDKIPVRPPVRVVGLQSNTLAPVQRVHSVIVRPDGSIVSPETTASTAPAPTPPAVVRTAALPNSDVPPPVPQAPAAEAPRNALPPLSAPAQIATAPVAVPSSARPTPIAQPSTLAPLPPANAPRLVHPPVVAHAPEAGAPIALSPNAPAQAPVRTASAAPQATAPHAAVEGASGEFMVQISSVRSDAEARHALQQAVQKFAALGVRGGDVQQANLGARGTYYRARLNGGSHEQAAALCQQIKSQGGDCVVAKR